MAKNYASSYFGLLKIFAPAKLLASVHWHKNNHLSSNSPFAIWSLAEQKTFIAEYHSCHRVTSFLSDKGISSPAQSFGKLLPSVRYQRNQPCRFCGGATYTRQVSNHSDLYHKRQGSLHCTGCDGWINLSQGDSFGDEYSWSLCPPTFKPLVSTTPPTGISINRVEELPAFEMLQLVENPDQIIVPNHSPCISWSLAELKAFIAEYHSCSKVAPFLIEKGITIPANHFARLLPRVLYHRKKPCRFCGCHRYTRRVSSRGDFALGSSGYLNCEGESCDAWIILSKGDYFGEENSLQNKLANKTTVIQRETKQINTSPVNQDFLKAILHRYVPEYQHPALTAYLSGSLTLEQVQERTGIFIEN